MGQTATQDLFDAAGVLLLKKGQPLTAGIRELLEKREVYIWRKGEETVFSRRQVKAFPRDVYFKLVGSLWSIYHEAKLIGAAQIEQTVKLVETILKELHTQNIYLDFDAIRLDMEQIKEHDYGTFVHVMNTALLTVLTGMRLRYTEKRLKYLALGALLHDLGKLKVPKEILNKPGSLTAEEFTIIKQHPLVGEDMLNHTRLVPVFERWSGNTMNVGTERGILTA